MTLVIHLFARARDLAGCSQLEVPLTDGSTVADLRVRLAVQVPALADLLRRSALAINGEFAHDAQRLVPGVEIALLPPVSGGQKGGVP